MKKLIVAAAVFALAGCASLTQTMTDHAVDAAGDVTGHAVENAGDRATDSAIDHAANAGKHEAKSEGQAELAAAKHNVTRMDPDDVLVLDGSTYAVGKVMGSPAADGSATVLLIADGRKLTTKDIVHVRNASKTELKIGADVYYTQDDDVRHGRWTKGAVTDTSHVDNNHVDVGQARELDTAAQIAVGR